MTVQTDSQTAVDADELDGVTLATIDRNLLERIVRGAHLPSLLAALAHATDDTSILEPGVRPRLASETLAMDQTGGLDAAARDRAVELVVETILANRERLAEAVADTVTDDLSEIFTFLTGSDDPAYRDIILHELGIPPERPEATWTKESTAADRDFRVIVVGAGMSGIAMAHELVRAGVDVLVLERADDVGGVWLANDYPGAKLDTSNFTYSYSFAQRADWADQYSSRDEVLNYLRDVADQFDLRRHMRFGVSVERASFDRGTGSWTVEAVGPDGPETFTSNVFVSAVGQLSEPNIPAIDGAETFAGAAFHTAEWRHDVELEGRNVALIGTGASAFQVVPPVAKVASHLTVFQRTPAWVIPTADYNAPLAPAARWLFEQIPTSGRWYRFNQFWTNVDGIRRLAEVDPGWDGEGTVSAENARMREALAEGFRSAFAGRPDLTEQLIPTYAPYAKRTVRDDGTWSSALKRDNVTLTSSGIERISERAVHTKDGVAHAADAIVYGTGFRASDFLSSIEVVNADGVTLQEYWAEDARAFYGLMVPTFPNFFMLYGPNTNLNVNSSVVLFSEAGAEFVSQCIRELLERESTTIAVREEPFRELNEKIDRDSQGLAIGVSTVNTWYKNRFGRNSQNWAGSTLEYWQGTHEFEPENFDIV